jgi:hypothetical protein
MAEHIKGNEMWDEKLRGAGKSPTRVKVDGIRILRSYDGVDHIRYWI